MLPMGLTTTTLVSSGVRGGPVLPWYAYSLELQSKCNSTDSVWPQHGRPIDHALSEQTARSSGRCDSSADFIVDDEGFLDGPSDSACGMDASDALTLRSESHQHISNQANSRALWIKHLASSDRTRQDSVSRNGSVVFGSPDVPRLWNSINPNLDSSSHTELSETESTQRPPLGGSECSHPPTDTQRASTMWPEDTKAAGDVDEDELEVADLLHLIGSSLDRFNAILHPSELSATDSRSIGEPFSDRITDPTSSDYGSFEPSVDKPTHFGNLNEASDKHQLFRPQLSTSCPDETALRSLPRLPSFNLFAGESFSNLEPPPVHCMQPHSSDTLTEPGKTITPSCFPAWPTGGSGDQQHRAGSISHSPFGSACAPPKQAGTSDVQHTLTLQAAGVENVASNSIGCSVDANQSCMLLGSSDPRSASYLLHSVKFAPFGGRTRQSLSCSQPTGDNLYSLDAILSGVDLLSLNRSPNQSVGGSKRRTSSDPKTSSTSQLEQLIGPTAPPGLNAGHGYTWSRECNTYAANPVKLQSVLRGGRKSVLSACFSSEHNTLDGPTIGAEQTFSSQSDPLSSPHSNRGLFSAGSFPDSSTFGVAFSPNSPLPYPFTSAVPFVATEPPPRMPVVLDAPSAVDAQNRGVYLGTSKPMYTQVKPTPRFENHSRPFIHHGLPNVAQTPIPLSASIGEATIQRQSPSGASSSGSNVSRALQSMLSPDSSSAPKPVLAKWRRACSFYLRGYCKKEDCEFAHDLTKVTCKFWEMGECFKGSTCPFLHGYPPEIAPSDTPAC
ncbi:unnamed protein product [Dicrocoelium dendriticum]|nr:unnamed protein product [Dicrocoelium dendriticum]